MKTIFISNPECNKHINPVGHPEQVSRLTQINRTLNGNTFRSLNKKRAALGTFQDVLTLHTKEYLDLIIKKFTAW